MSRKKVEVMKRNRKEVHAHITKYIQNNKNNTRAWEVSQRLAWLNCV